MDFFGPRCTCTIPLYQKEARGFGGSGVTGWPEFESWLDTFLGTMQGKEHNLRELC